YRHGESVAPHALHLVPQRDRHRSRGLLAVVVGANDHLLRPLRRPLAQLFLRLLQAAPIECAAARSQPRSWVGFWKRRRRVPPSLFSAFEALMALFAATRLY